jgi:mono/diheme cytochrome c family protein
LVLAGWSNTQTASGAEDAKGATAPAQQARQFEAQVAPLLVRQCVECHGPQAKKGRLDLSRKDAALAGGESGKAIVPGKADESLLWQYVESDEMPKGRTPLSAEEKRLLRQWLDAGAVWSLKAIGSAKSSAERRLSDVALRRLTVPEYIETVRSAVGVNVEREALRLLPPDLRADGFSNTAYTLGVDLTHVEAYARLAEIAVGKMDVPAFAARFSQRRELNDAAIRELIARMGRWLMRGPLEEHEITAFLKVSQAVAAQGGNYEEAVRYVIEAMLQSPRFIYRIERQAGDGSSQRVSGFELASRLSYILWGGPPDEELLRAAEAGELADRRRVEEQVRRMLQDPRAVQRSAQFIHEWMDLDRLSHLRPSASRFPQWSKGLAADMREETLVFFKDVAWEQKRPIWEILNAQVTFATPRLARHYGLDPNRAGDAPAQAAPQAPQGPQRVKSGLQALYLFDEGSGNTVRDVSDSGEPLHLKIADGAAVNWSEQGLVVQSSTLIASAAPPKRLIDAVKKSQAITLEAWITPANASQSGPARIMTLSVDTGARNFTLGQDGDKYDVRFRSTKTDANGMPSLPSPGGAVASRPTHVVFTRDRSGKAKLYVDGHEKAARVASGDLSNWDGNFRLALANELSRDRAWQGTLHVAAVFDRALSAEEVRQNHAAGAQPGSPARRENSIVYGVESTQALQALYRFDEGGGDKVRDTSGAGEPLHLKIENPVAVQWDQAGLSVHGPTLIAAANPPQRLIDAVKKSQAITLEAWITPADAQQKGPARILTLSSGVLERNFTLGQEADVYDVRFRSTTTSPSGIPSLSSPSGMVATRPTHVVYTRDASGKAKLYLDGEEKAAKDVSGNLSNWDGAHRLALANETSHDRPWRGKYHLVAIYSRALSGEEVRANSRARAEGGAWRRYDLTSVPGRGGLLTQGSALTIGGDEASMVTRGLFVLHELLYSGVADPPPCVDTRPVPTKPGLTQRAVAEARIANQACGGCHAKFEPLAFGLEKFDGVGAFQEADEHGNKLREDGEILFPDQERPVTYKTSAELMDLLAGSDRVRRAITRKVTQFAIGRPIAETDEPVIDAIHQAALKAGGTYADLLTAIVLSDLVQTKPATAEVAAVERPAPQDRPAPQAAPAKAERVSQGLQALYTFLENGGNTVHDVSSAGQPLNLNLADPAAVRWSEQGLTVNSATLIAGEQSPARLIEAIKKSKAITLEAWITPAAANQSGPARILTLSSGIGQRNFTLGQQQDKFDVRFRTTKTDGNGLPSLASPGGTVQTKKMHVVFTRAAEGAAKLYINGEERAAGSFGGDPSNWSQDFRLALANETSRDRPWLGTLHLIAVYDRALSADEVRRNRAAGDR